MHAFVTALPPLSRRSPFFAPAFSSSRSQHHHLRQPTRHRRNLMTVKAVSAVPGVQTIEKQPPKSPINGSSTVLIIGASRGIGLEFVSQCAQKNAVVYATYRSSASVGLKKLSEKYSDTVKMVEMDVTDSSSIQSASKKIETAKVTHVIHNAGVGAWGSLSQVTVDDMLYCYRVNAMGVVLVAQVLAGLLKNRPVYGVLSSKVGSVDDNASGSGYAYRASKSACNNIVKSLSIDLADDISFVLLHPGYVRTDMTGGAGFIGVDESVAGMLKAVEATDETVGFRFVDYKAELIPW